MFYTQSIVHSPIMVSSDKTTEADKGQSQNIIVVVVVVVVIFYPHFTNEYISF